MKDLIQLIWKYKYRDGTISKYYTIFLVDKLVGDSSKYINGFNSLASDAIPEEIRHLNLTSSHSMNGQYDERLLYFTPVKESDIELPKLEFEDPDGIPSIYKNNTTKESYSTKPRKAIQIITEMFSGYVIDLDIVEESLELDPTEKDEVYLDTFRLFSVGESTITLNSEYQFSKETIWKYRTPAILQLISLSNSTNNYANALVQLDRFSYVIPNIISDTEQISTVRSFHETSNKKISVNSNTQIIDGMITGRNNESVFSEQLFYNSRGTRLDIYDYREYDN